MSVHPTWRAWRILYPYVLYSHIKNLYQYVQCPVLQNFCCLVAVTVAAKLCCVILHSISSVSIPPAQRSWQEFLPKFRQWHDSNQDRATWLTPTRAMVLLTCESWQDWCSVTFSDLWSNHCEGSKRNSCHSFSLWPPGTAEKLPIKYELWSHRSHDEVLHLA